VIAIWQLSSLLVCPEPIPIIDLFFASTIALDFTYRQILKANIKFSNSFLLGLFFETILKSSFEKIFLSSVCTKIALFNTLNFKISFIENLEESISLKFFFNLSNFSALSSKPFAIITSVKILLSSMAKFFLS